MAKHEAQEKLTEYNTEYTGRLTSQGNSITTFSELWKAFWAVTRSKSSQNRPDRGKTVTKTHQLSLFVS